MRQPEQAIRNTQPLNEDQGKFTASIRKSTQCYLMAFAGLILPYEQ
jgi:hypothetical protein